MPLGRQAQHAGRRNTGGVEDLIVPPGPGLPEGLVVPGDLLQERFSHASGPGGQGVNTSDSRVQLSLDLATVPGLGEDQRQRLLDRLAGRLVDGVISVDAAEFRSQLRNRRAARERLAEVLRTALAPPPPPRRATRPTRGSRQRRLEAKHRRAQIKQNRRTPHRSDPGSARRAAHWPHESP